MEDLLDRILEGFGVEVAREDLQRRRADQRVCREEPADLSDGLIPGLLEEAEVRGGHCHESLLALPLAIQRHFHLHREQSSLVIVAAWNDNR